MINIKSIGKPKDRSNVVAQYARSGGSRGGSVDWAEETEEKVTIVKPLEVTHGLTANAIETETLSVTGQAEFMDGAEFYDDIYVDGQADIDGWAYIYDGVETAVVNAQEVNVDTAHLETAYIPHAYIGDLTVDEASVFNADVDIIAPLTVSDKITSDSLHTNELYSNVEDYIKVKNDMLLDDADLGTFNFQSGLNGWNIDKLGDAEFQNLKVRGGLDVFLLTYNEMRATNGIMLVTDTDQIDAYRKEYDEDEEEWFYYFTTHDIPHMVVDDYLWLQYKTEATPNIRYGIFHVLSVDTENREICCESAGGMGSQDFSDCVGQYLIRSGNTTDTNRQTFIKLNPYDGGYIDFIKTEGDNLNPAYNLKQYSMTRLGYLNGIRYNGEELNDYGLFSNNAYLVGGIKNANGMWELSYNGSGQVANGAIHWNSAGEIIVEPISGISTTAYVQIKADEIVQKINDTGIDINEHTIDIQVDGESKLKINENESVFSGTVKADILYEGVDNYQTDTSGSGYWNVMTGCKIITPKTNTIQRVKHAANITRTGKITVTDHIIVPYAGNCLGKVIEFYAPSSEKPIGETGSSIFFQPMLVKTAIPNNNITNIVKSGDRYLSYKYNGTTYTIDPDYYIREYDVVSNINHPDLYFVGDKGYTIRDFENTERALEGGIMVFDWDYDNRALWGLVLNGWDSRYANAGQYSKVSHIKMVAGEHTIGDNVYPVWYVLDWTAVDVATPNVATGLVSD